MWPWYRWMPRRWEREQEIARRYMTDVRARIDCDGLSTLAGRYALRSRYVLRDTFDLRIVYPDDFLPIGPRFGMLPTVALSPRVYLDSHHDVWRQSLDAHILSDWSLCLYVPGESGIDFTWPDALERLFAVIHTFLTLQRIYQRDLARSEAEARVEWPGPWRAHGVPGLVEAVRARGGLADGEPCICGSGKRFAECHRARVQRYIELESEAA